MKVALQKIVPLTEARSKFCELAEDASGQQYFVVVKRNRPRVAIVDIDYLTGLEREVEKKRMKEIENIARKKFKEYVKKKYGKDKISEEEGYRILTGKKLSL